MSFGDTVVQCLRGSSPCLFLVFPQAALHFFFPPVVVSISREKMDHCLLLPFSYSLFSPQACEVDLVMTAPRNAHRNWQAPCRVLQKLYHRDLSCANYDKVLLSNAKTTAATGRICRDGAHRRQAPLCALGIAPKVNWTLRLDKSVFGVQYQPVILTCHPAVT